MLLESQLKAVAETVVVALGPCSVTGPPHVGATPSSVPKDNSDGSGGGVDILLGIV